jgi:hypothetical protein
MGDYRNQMGHATDKKHCDRCRKKSFVFYESRYWYAGDLCGPCRTQVFKEVDTERLYGEIKSHDYTVNQGPPLDEFCEEPFY